MWLGGLSATLRTEKSLVQFPVRAHAWVVGHVPSWVMKKQLINVSLAH